MRQMIRKLEKEFLSHLPYSSDQTLSDCHLFHPMQHSLFEQNDEKFLEVFIKSKLESFFHEEICNSAER